MKPENCPLPFPRFRKYISVAKVIQSKSLPCPFPRFHNQFLFHFFFCRNEKNILPATAGSRWAADTFHFVSYVPINGHLIELDGLKRYPIDHGPWDASLGEDWTTKFRKVIADRLGLNKGVIEHDIRFALMAVVPDRRVASAQKLTNLRLNRRIVVEALKQLIQEDTDSSSTSNSSEVDSHEVLVLAEGDDEKKREVERLEKDIARVMANPRVGSNNEEMSCSKLMRRISRTSSVDSASAANNNPGSPFQSNPLLVSHYYAKSPEEVAPKDEGSEGEPKEKVPKVEDFDPREKKLDEPQKFAPKDLLSLLRNIDLEIHACEANIREENEKRKKHRVDDCRRTHNYDEFITTFVSMLAEQGQLGDLLELGLNPKSSNVKKKVNGEAAKEKVTSSNVVKKVSSNGAGSSGSSATTGSASRIKQRSNTKKPGRPKKKK